MEPEDQVRGDAVDNSAASQCERCGAQTRDELVQAAFWSERGLIAIDHVPARVCPTCGEQSYDPETARTIEKLVASPAGKPGREILVPVFSLADVEIPNAESGTRAVDEEGTDAVEFTFPGREGTAGELAADHQSEATCRCPHCDFETHEEVVKSVFWTAQGLIAIEDIPARVCRRCREAFYDEETTGKIAALTQQAFPPIEPNRRIVAPVFSLADNT